MSHSEGKAALMDEARCPSDQTLSEYLLGKLADAEFSIVAGHIESCRRCDAIAESLEGLPDMLLDNLKHASRGGGYLGEPELWKTLIGLLDECRRSDDCGRVSSLSRFRRVND